MGRSGGFLCNYCFSRPGVIMMNNFMFPTSEVPPSRWDGVWGDLFKTVDAKGFLI